MGSVLVVAFDGMDRELLERWDCERLLQEFHGGIDVTTGITVRKTSEIFASFLTGATHEEHGVRGLSFIDDPRIDRFERAIHRIPGVSERSRLRQALYRSMFGARRRRPDREDLDAPAFIDRVPGAEALFVPAYNPSPVWKYRNLMDYPHLDELEQELDKEFAWRKRALLDALGEEQPLLVAHIHRPDFMHHFHGDDLDAVREVYREMDDLAGEIRSRADHDTVLFLSDHGRPTPRAHTGDAFWSATEPLFEEEPHITEFHDRILRLVDAPGIDV